MDTIMEIAGRHDIGIVEDNAHGLFGKYKGKYLGTFGCMAAQSFHETKNFTCGEGGALLINDSELIERAEIVREKGTNRSRFLRGQVDKYTWVDIGSSYLHKMRRKPRPVAGDEFAEKKVDILMTWVSSEPVIQSMTQSII